MRKLLSTIAIGLVISVSIARGQQPAAPAEGAAEDPAAGALRGSIVEDRAAKLLLQAGDARLEADETAKAVEIWKSVIERYPRSKHRFDAHLRLGGYFLDRDRAYDRARVHFEAAAAEENKSEEQRAEATLRLGVCFFHARNYGKCFQVLREVIEKFPVSPQVNEAYYYIGLGHFQQGHYSRAIAALEKVGTTLSAEAGQAEKLEAGKRLFVKIEDADLAVLEPDQTIDVICRSSGGDEEKVACYPVGRNVRLVLGSVVSKLGKPAPNNGTLEVKGGDKVQVTYTDEHTAEKKLKVPVLKEVVVVGNALVAITDGAFAETVNGTVLGKSVNLRIADPDRDLGDAPDKIKALVEVYRLKTDEELEAEAIAKAKGTPAATPAGDATEESEIERWKVVDRVEITLTEAKVQAVVTDRPAVGSGSQESGVGSQEGQTPAAPAEGAPAAPVDPAVTAAPVDDGSIHTGVFQAVVPLVKADVAIAGDDTLQALPADEVRLVYLDEVHTKDGTRQVQAVARALEGNIGGVRVTKAEISDQELRIQTQLKTADALTQIGNRYKEFGLKEKAVEKYELALNVCEEVAGDARKLGGALLEQTYVQLWNIYFAMDRLPLAAAMCERLQREFPNSGFVDDALLQLAEVAKKQGDWQRAIGIFSRLVSMQTSLLRGEAQFGVAECYELQALANKVPASAAQLQDRAFQEFKRVYDEFPDSGRVGEAVAKMANYYYVQKDYARAIDTFETVLNNQPDAKFLDVILFNYGRCLYRMERKAEAKQRFDQLLSEFPESPLAADAKKISDALASAGGM